MNNPDKKRDFPYTIRPLTTVDIDQYNALLRYAFQLTEEDLMKAGWQADEIRQSKFPVLERAHVLGCYDEEELISQFAVYPLRMNIYGVSCSIGFITSVSTYPEYSGQGIMSRLLRKSLAHMREKGQVMALLYPYSIPLYRRFGWEIISNKISYRIKDSQIPTKTHAPGYIRRVSWDNEDFRNLHDEFARQTHGCLYRNYLAWEEYWRWAVEDTTVAIYYSVADKPLGYMVYLLQDDIMHIKEMIYLNREAQKGLWEYIRAHNSMIDEVRGNTYFSEPIAFNLEDGDIKETIRPYIMGRIVDVAEFFRQYRCDPLEQNTAISFTIVDDIMDSNNRTFNVLFHEGHCSLLDEPAENHVTMSIGILTTLLLGYKTATQLHRLELIEADEKTVLLLDDVIMHEAPYISDYI